jgi:hypothetical protein
MKTYKVTYMEKLVHEFYVDAESLAEASNIFDQKLNYGEVDFSDGYLVDSSISIVEDESESEYTPSATNGDYSPSNPWDAPGMKLSDFI